MCLEVWGVRRPRAWRRGRVLPIWQGYSRIRPLHRNQVSKILQLPESGVVLEVWSERRSRA